MKSEGRDFFCIRNTFSHEKLQLQWKCAYSGFNVAYNGYRSIQNKRNQYKQYSTVLVMHCIIRLPPLKLPHNFTSQISPFYFMYTISIINVIIYKFIFMIFFFTIFDFYRFLFYRFKEANGGVPFDPPKVEAPKKEPVAPVEKGPSKKCKENLMLCLTYGCDT
jgi:hypothetical protein